jgi:ubiquinone/menaquinone biosynthesis C-methylase UbiE
MPDMVNRLADLSPQRRRLLERLLNAPGDRSDAAASPPADQSGMPGTRAVGRGAPVDAAPWSSDPKTLQRQAYNSLNRDLSGGPFGRHAYFLNFGYVSDGSPEYSVVSLPEQALNKHCIKLVLELIGDCDLRDRSVLDVGCGRGGTVHVIRRYFEPHRAVGLDLSREAVAFCRSAHRQAGIDFLEGDAEALPFAGRSFDVVTNIESSHAYPAPEAFHREVSRVLRPGGDFLWTDVLRQDQWARSIDDLRSIGFTIAHDRDVTPNVLRSCQEIAAVRQAAFNPASSPIGLQDFLAVPGSTVYNEMATAATAYRILRLTKPR